MHWRRRIREWLVALRLARGAGTPIPWLKMFVAMLTPVPRRVWRERIRCCRVCPLFDAEHYICRGTVGRLKDYGCGCHLPMKALSPAPYDTDEHGAGCWGRAMFGEPFGWGEHVFPSRWAKATAFVRFLLRR